MELRAQMQQLLEAVEGAAVASQLDEAARRTPNRLQIEVLEARIGPGQPIAAWLWTLGYTYPRDSDTPS